ncbi:sugar phosphate nucleotidyltransferase [Verrucomicrobiota bacterium]
MKKPKKAILLAAGYGTRMRPLSGALPKPMMPVWGRPAIGRMIDLMRKWGIKEILVNVHHNPNELFEYLKGRSGDGIKISVSFEPEILGTGGVLKRAEWFIDDEPFWMVNTDIAADLSPLPFLREFEKDNRMAVLLLNGEQGPRTVEMCRNKITTFWSNMPGTNGTYTFCGIQLVSPELMKHLPDEKFFSIIEAYKNAMTAGKRVSGIVVEKSFWAELGDPEKYSDAHHRILASYRNDEAGKCLFNPEVPKIDGRVVINADRVANESLRKALRKLRWPESLTTILPMSGRGSDRTFARLVYGNKSALFMHYSRKRRENVLYVPHARFLLKQGIMVPKILVDSPSSCTSVIEDLGFCTLESELKNASAKTREHYYRKVIDSLVRMHSIPQSRFKNVKMEPPFSAKSYEWERELMACYFLKDRLGLNARDIRGIMNDLKDVACKLLKIPHVLIHRDMQSSNVLLCGKRKKPAFIDFQGMRLGPAVYDVASLLCDPYMMLSESNQLQLIRYYGSLSGRKDIEEGFWYAAVERLAQALGAFGRLSAHSETKRFELYIEPALKMMKRALSHLDGFDHLKKMTKLLA